MEKFHEHYLFSVKGRWREYGGENREVMLFLHGLLFVSLIFFFKYDIKKTALIINVLD